MKADTRNIHADKRQKKKHVLYALAEQLQDAVRKPRQARDVGWRMQTAHVELNIIPGLIFAHRTGSNFGVNARKRNTF